MKPQLKLGLALATLTLVACAQPQGNDRWKEKADIEAGADQAKTDQKVQEMETRLARQQRFFHAMSGTFTGKMQIDTSVFDVTFSIVPTIPIYDGSRIRTIEEVTYDLTNLALNIDSSISKKMGDGSDFTMGCVFTDQKPKLDSGFVLATSSNCAQSWTLSVSDGGRLPPGRVGESRENITRKVLDGQLDRIDALDIQMRAVHKSSVTSFRVHRVDESLKGLQ